MPFILLCFLLFLNSSAFSQVPKNAFNDYRGKNKVSVNKQQTLSGSEKNKPSLNPLSRSQRTNPDKENKKKSKILMRQIKKDKRIARRNKD